MSTTPSNKAPVSTTPAFPVSGRYIGKEINRVDGPLKVTGAATYAAEWDLPGLLHAVVVGSPIASGKILKIDADAVRKMPGVVEVITHENRGPFGKHEGSMMSGMIAEARLPLEDNNVIYAGQCVAMVVAETAERARAAAFHLQVTYEKSPEYAMTIENSRDKYAPAQFNGEPVQLERGDVEKALAEAPVRLDRTYETPCEHPCALEPHATIADWSDGKLVVRNASQWAMGDLGVLSDLLGISKDRVHIIAPFVGGMFGSKAMTLPHVILTALATKKIGRPVKTVLTREQVLTTVGYRSRTIQRFEIGASKEGKLTAMRHATISQTSMDDEFVEPTNITSRHLYEVKHYKGTHELRRVHTMLPSWMRAPGEATCQFAQESLMDELAVELNMDPVALRKLNNATKNGQSGLPFSSKHLNECFDRGAELCGWSRRKAQPGAAKDGKLLIGYGTATATYPAYIMGAAVKARLEKQGSGVRLVVQTAGADVGTGLYTVIALTAAEALSMPMEMVTAQVGDTAFPPAAVAGGSNLTASTAPAVFEACRQIRSNLCGIAVSKKGPFAGRAEDDLEYEDAAIHLASSPSKKISYADLLQLAAQDSFEAQAQTAPLFGHNDQFHFQSFGAVFAEVAVDPNLHTVRTRHLTGVFDVGRVMNAKATRSQLYGGMIFGLGMALLEELVPDPVQGRFVNADLADYMVAVNADVPEIDVAWTNKPDLDFNPLGCRGVGEIGNTGTSAAIANAVFNATGKRIRSLPILPEKLMYAS